MLRKINLYEIPREIRDALRQLQDVNSKEMDLDGSDTGSQGSTEPGEPEESEIEERRGGRGEDERREPRAKSQHENNKQDDEEYIVNKEG
jgi:hypothetical protein